MTSQLLETMRELHSRTVDGIHVRLLWRPDPDLLAVAVTDARSGASFALDVRDGERAMDVFRHPFAYHAWRCTT
ncbi:hypothetical protein FSW04_07350 [Baekduia soli]|uniref:Uncharacterized protein n=1 Tax=Baekduia soli TaxID=496014 RepID=A0A5B8U357_9ACTN|nr:hypothetical protein [Baekduia soli]QEC47413.1 hypothetical protein FSW04_07350 [Baekduia soli]